MGITIKLEKIGLGGGCHWCTEGIFQSLIGVHQVDQGWIASDGANQTYSEAVVVCFDPKKISLKTLIKVHLYTHASTSNHSMRSKYRSAIYTNREAQHNECRALLEAIKKSDNQIVITELLPFKSFKMNDANYLNYLYSRPESPFCNTYIIPKISGVVKQFSAHVNLDKMSELGL